MTTHTLCKCQYYAFPALENLYQKITRIVIATIIVSVSEIYEIKIYFTVLKTNSHAAFGILLKTPFTMTRSG